VRRAPHTRAFESTAATPCLDNVVAAAVAAAVAVAVAVAIFVDDDNNADEA
jgi:hypothetical protein